MSIVTLFTRKSPTLNNGSIEFDAVIEDELESTVDVAGYPIESGARAADHRIIQPIKWRLTGVISNNPLRPSLTDFTGLLNNLGGGVGAQVAGLNAGFLAGSDDTRASSALQALFTLQTTGEPFDIDAGDFTLSNMVITELRRVKNAANENGLVFDAQLQEMPTLDTILSENRQPQQEDLRDGDPAQSQAASSIDKGEQSLTASPPASSAAVLGIV